MLKPVTWSLLWKTGRLGINIKKAGLSPNSLCFMVPSHLHTIVESKTRIRGSFIPRLFLLELYLTAIYSTPAKAQQYLVNLWNGVYFWKPFHSEKEVKFFAIIGKTALLKENGMELKAVFASRALLILQFESGASEFYFFFFQKEECMICSTKSFWAIWLLPELLPTLNVSAFENTLRAAERTCFASLGPGMRAHFALCHKTSGMLAILLCRRLENFYHLYRLLPYSSCLGINISAEKRAPIPVAAL